MRTREHSMAALAVAVLVALFNLFLEPSSPPFFLTHSEIREFHSFFIILNLYYLSFFVILFVYHIFSLLGG